MRYLLALVMVAVSLLVFLLGGMGIWQVFYEPTAPKDPQQYQEQQKVFCQSLGIIWVFSLIAFWAVISWFRKPPEG